MTTNASEQPRAAGALLIAASALSVFGMLHHPVAQGEGLQRVQNLAAIGPFAADVHAGLVAVMLIQMIGYAGLATRLGSQRLVVQGAFLAQAAGAMALTGAAAINGFALAAQARRLLAAGYILPEQYQPSIWALFGQARAWEQLGTGAWAIALLLWGLAVWPQQRWLGLLALPLVLVPLASGFGLLPLGVVGFGAVVAAQGIWAVAAGTLLLRGQLGVPHTAP
jgi:hypothetical protein